MSAREHDQEEQEGLPTLVRVLIAAVLLVVAFVLVIDLVELAGVL